MPSRVALITVEAQRLRSRRLAISVGVRLFHGKGGLAGEGNNGGVGEGKGGGGVGGSVGNEDSVGGVGLGVVRLR